MKPFSGLPALLSALTLLALSGKRLRARCVDDDCTVHYVGMMLARARCSPLIKRCFGVSGFCQVAQGQAADEVITVQEEHAGMGSCTFERTGHTLCTDKIRHCIWKTDVKTGASRFAVIVAR